MHFTSRDNLGGTPEAGDVAITITPPTFCHCERSAAISGIAELVPITQEEFAILKSQFVTLKKGRDNLKVNRTTLFSLPLKIRGVRGVMKQPFTKSEQLDECPGPYSSD